MASLIHIAEVASILAVAYMVGWVVGYVAHRLAAPAPVVATVPAERLAAVTGGDALVKAPVIAPLAAPPQVAGVEPAKPAIEPVATSSEPAPSAEPAPSPAILEKDASVPSEAIAPATEADLDAVPASEPEAGPTQPAAAVDEPVADLPASVSTEPEPPTPAEAPAAPEPQPEPAGGPDAPAPELQPEAATAPAAPSSIRSFRRFRSAIARSAAEPVQPAPAQPIPAPPPAPFSATPASRPGEAFAGEIRGREAAQLTAVKDELASLAAAAAVAAAPGPAPAPEPEPVAAEAPQAEAAMTDTPAADPEPPPATAAAPVVSDEDAAMRAIEGGWSRVHTRALDGAPELSDLGAAVVAAQAAVEQVLAKAGIDADAAGQGMRPRGLSRPRNGVKDDLRRIEGIGALDESTLNNLGIYHFDQIANWNDAQILWMESHVFARGRIGHEQWQRQARELVASPAA